MPTVKIATWNVNSLSVRLPQVLDWLRENGPDCLCLQETKLPDERFPVAAFEALGYQCLFHGQRTYNGVAILARGALTDGVRGLPGLEDGQARLVAATLGDLRVVNVYVPNGQEVGSDKYAYKLRWLGQLRDLLAGELTRHPRLILLGDFNIAPGDLDVYDPELLSGQILLSGPEREALVAVQTLGLSDAFRHRYPETRAYSWWDYRAGMFRRDLGLRIDLILASEPLLPAVREAVIDREARRAERPSDHAPVWVELTGC